MKKLHEQLSVAAVALAATPVAVLNLISTGSPTAITFAALAALLAGIVTSMAAVKILREWY